ncbi:C4-dicarboxylate transport protein [Legionella massiliensis]|uniref:C4-dicarboxylate transport protein n=1 Tax=Legionella massiliensis TaxID=1034943 RepID=A0A078KXP0_9GAMM|nr:C4-dicarboxylate transporter DctA [Legionella massiliensis]CDZ79185.1 C4-dicarboxylate transport protein [Legionella massiliensis]CEE14923.1 Aerobic C4-dicarboxylate transport protein [Legionella massiliensis]
MRLIKSLYFWVFVAFISGSLFGLLKPEMAIAMEPLGTNFIKIIKIFIGPIVFLTVTTGIAQTGSLKKLGKIGLKAIIYFELVSTVALLIGWSAALIFKPGAMLHADVKLLDPQAVAQFVKSAEHLGFVQFLENIIPTSIIEPFAKGDMLQVLFLAILLGISLLAVGEEEGKLVFEFMEKLTKVLFRAIRIIMYAAPLGVFGAMAFTLAKFGSQFFIPLLGLILTFYLAGLIFIFLVLGSVARITGFSILQFLKYLAPELFIVLGTSSSEAALPQLLQKLENLGCEQETVGVVVPMGYSFNLDGTNIYITLAALFIAQALGIHLSILEQFTLFVTAMLSSKGAAGITGAGFITLAATLSVVPLIPPVGIVLILGIDRFMSEARSLINFIGNGVATLAISRWEKEISAEQLAHNLEMHA